MNELTIHTEFITLGQFLQMINVISSGGMAKWFLAEHVVYVNDEQEQRRGKKLHHGDTVRIPDVGSYQINKVADGSSNVH